MSYYLYTNGVLKLVDSKKPRSLGEYMEYVSNLPSIQVSEELKAKWKEGSRYTKDLDFVIRKIDPIGLENENTGNPTAVPTPYDTLTHEEADELWNEVVAKVATHDIVRQVKPADNVQKLVDWKKKVIEQLKSKYNITRK